MAYEDTNCPCGGKKARETMLCPACQQEFAQRREMAGFQNETAGFEYRRHCAIALLGMARRRSRTNEHSLRNAAPQGAE